MVRLDKEYEHIVFSSEIRDLVEQNSSFDKGILRVCYVGQNKNKSYISKETMESCLPTMYNCPIVCRYERATDSIGAHDVDLVRNASGGLSLVNTTHPVGVVPSGANYWYEEIDDGIETHEYLCVEVLLWKRQEAYAKIKEDGIVAESMEIKILNSEKVDGILHINKFEFTAFCLLGSAAPCFESASLEVFSLDDFKNQMDEMMDDYKASFNLLSPNTQVDIEKENVMEGGNVDMEVVTEQVAAQEVPGSEVIDEVVVETTATEENFSDETEAAMETYFALAEQFKGELMRTLRTETVTNEWGECPRYWYCDHDPERFEVYAIDSEDGNLYGFSYSMNGDNVVIDFTTKMRKKMVIADFDEGAQGVVFSALIDSVVAICSDSNAKLSQKYNDVFAEAEELRKFKIDTEANSIFAEFDDLNGIDAFEQLKGNYSTLSRDELEEKCFAIRGRMGYSAKFSLEETSKKLPVEKIDHDSGPYNGVFAKYGIV